MTRIINIGSSYFPFAFRDTDGLGNAKIDDPLVIYTVIKGEEEDEPWEDREITSIRLIDTVNDFLFLKANPNDGRIYDEPWKARLLAKKFRELAEKIEEHLPEDQK